MSITLQSTVGGFSAEFRRRLPALEAAMIEHGLDPSGFVISKDRSLAATTPVIGPFFYDYTVFVDGAHFTVTEPNDARFMDYLTRRCVAPDDGDAITPQHKANGLLRKLLRWMDQPI